MRIQSKFRHIDSEKIIIKVSIWDKDTHLGSAHGQASSVEEAEDRAIERVLRQLSNLANCDISQNPDNTKVKGILTNGLGSNIEAKTSKILDNSQNLHVQDKIENYEHNDPDDWSSELALIDNELSRIGWQKNDESLLLDRLLGIDRRSKITEYKDIKLVLTNLKSFNYGDNPANVNLIVTKEFLIEQGNKIMQNNNISNSYGKKLLIDKFNYSNRMELNHQQLQEFNSLLSNLSNKDI